MEENKKESGWEPKVVGFLCTWCSSAGADLAGTSRLKYPPNIRIIKVPCSGKVNPIFVLKALEQGADMVLVSGCHPGDCHYLTGNYFTRRRIPAFRELLSFVGIDPRRLQISWVSAAEGGKWARLVGNITQLARELGPLEKIPKLT